MKFLITIQPRTGTALPQGEELGRLQLATYDWIQSQQASGTIDCVYNIVPRGGVAIVNAESPAEIMAALAEYPLAPYVDIEVQMLIDLAASAELARKRISG